MTTVVPAPPDALDVRAQLPAHIQTEPAPDLHRYVVRNPWRWRIAAGSTVFAGSLATVAVEPTLVLPAAGVGAAGMAAALLARIRHDQWEPTSLRHFKPKKHV